MGEIVVSRKIAIEQVVDIKIIGKRSLLCETPKILKDIISLLFISVERPAKKPPKSIYGMKWNIITGERKSESLSTS